MTRWLWLLLLVCCHCQELPELPNEQVTWHRWLDRLLTSLFTCLVILGYQRRKPPKAPKAVAVVAGDVNKDLETFRQLARRVRGDPKTVEEALSFVQALCEGLNASQATSKIIDSEAFWLLLSLF